jgi:hypothetical protein
MPAIVSNEQFAEVFSLAVADRSKTYADLVSNSNAILKLMKDKGSFKEASGPHIRERLKYNQNGNYIRYSGYEILNAVPYELFSDAVFDWKQAAIPVTLSFTDILKNSGQGQILNVMEEHIQDAEDTLEDRFTEDLHSDGTADGGRQIGGLALAVPIVANTGVYGGIDRATVTNWQTKSYDASTDFGGSITAVDKTSMPVIMSTIINATSRGKMGPDCIASSFSHYNAYEQSLQGIQRITDENGSKLGSLGFTSLKYYGAGRSIDVVLEGGIGSAMPADTSYFLDTKSLRFRYHKDRNFTAFGGKRQPVNQDAIVEMIGFMGNLTLRNPIHTSRLRG